MKLHIHIGGGWYVLVTSGYWCIDVRKFYMARDNNIKPTRKGFAIRINEWDGVKRSLGILKNRRWLTFIPAGRAKITTTKKVPWRVPSVTHSGTGLIYEQQQRTIRFIEFYLSINEHVCQYDIVSLCTILVYERSTVSQ